MDYDNIEPAYFSLLSRLIKDGLVLDHVEKINQGRYVIAFGKYQEEDYNILIMFKREPFYNFGIMFRSKGYHGLGDTINQTDIKYAFQRQVKRIYSIFKNGKAYSISIEDFMDKSIKWTNRENKEVYSIALTDYHIEYHI